MSKIEALNKLSKSLDDLFKIPEVSPSEDKIKELKSRIDKCKYLLVHHKDSNDINAFDIFKEILELYKEIVIPIQVYKEKEKLEAIANLVKGSSKSNG